MALDNWFQNWNSPFFQHPFNEPIKNYSSDHDNRIGQKTPFSNKLLPFFLSLNLLKPPEEIANKNRQRLDTFFRPLEFLRNKEKYFNTNEDPSTNFETPLEYPETSRITPPFEVSEALNSKDKHSNADFRIPSEYPKSVNTKGKNSGRSYTHSLSFPDPFKGKLKTRPNGNMTYEEEHNLRPLELTGAFKTWYRWKILDFKYPSPLERSKAIATGDFVPENNLPLGIEVYKNRIFLSMPKWKAGVPVTLAQLPRVPKEESPQLVPYPNWEWHSEKSCDLITSVFRMYVDQCGRLWVLDSGKIAITTEEAKQHCPPKLLIFDLETDKLLDKFIFPKKFIKEDSLYSNIVVDIRNEDCHDAHAYLSDVWRFGIVVFRLFDHRAWRITDHLFFPDPLAAVYQLHHLRFEWTDGIFGMALGPVDRLNDERVLYFHPMSSFREFYVKTSYLRDESGEDNRLDAFKVLGQSRGPSGHISSSVMDKNGILYYNLVTRDSIGCWDSRKPYKRQNQGVIAKSKETLVFPNDMRLDKEKRQSMWIITNRLPYYLIEGLDHSRINFRVMSAYTDESIKGTICDPGIQNEFTYLEYNDGIDCY